MKRTFLPLALAALYIGLGIACSVMPWRPQAATAGATKAGASRTPSPETCPPERPSGKRTVILRGEIVDYYCYIEKGLTGPNHRECGLKCVAGDVCMGILTDQDELYMLSIDHIRAMTPTAFEGIPDPFQACRRLMAEKVELRGNAMERKGQKILEVVSVRRTG